MFMFGVGYVAREAGSKTRGASPLGLVGDASRRVYGDAFEGRPGGVKLRLGKGGDAPAEAVRRGPPRTEAYTGSFSLASLRLEGWDRSARLVGKEYVSAASSSSSDDSALASLERRSDHVKLDSSGSRGSSASGPPALGSCTRPDERRLFRRTKLLSASPLRLCAPRRRRTTGTTTNTSTAVRAKPPSTPSTTSKLGSPCRSFGAEEGSCRSHNKERAD